MEAFAPPLEPTLLKRLSQCTRLPTPPDFAARLAGACRPDCPADTFRALAALDPATAAKLLRIANAPLYGERGAGILTVDNAIAHLGEESARAMAGSMSVPSAAFYQRSAEPWRSELWARSAVAAHAARVIASVSRSGDPATLASIALLQDIGIWALQKSYPQLYADMDTTDHDTLCRRETDVLGCDHAAVSAWLLARWGLPAEAATLVAASHDVRAAPADLQARAAAVTNAGRIADFLLAPDTGRLRALATALSVDLCFAPDQVSEVIEQTELACRGTADDHGVALLPENAAQPLLDWFAHEGLRRHA